MSDEHNADETVEQENQPSVNRRSFVKALGAAGATVSFSGVSSANSSEWKSANKNQIKRLRQSTRVRNLKKELDGLQITPNNTSFNELDDDETGLVATKVTTPHGTLWFGEIESGETTARFDFNTDDSGANKQRRLPQRYRDIPGEAEAALVAKRDGVIFRRSATDGEHEILADETGLDVEKSIAATGSDIDGFYIASQTSDPTVEYQVTVPAAAESAMVDELTSSQFKVSSANKTTGEKSDIGIQAKCVTRCAACVASVAGNCVPCYFTCAGSPTGIGAIACVYCIKVRCELVTGGVCTLCLNCADRNGYI